MKTRRGVCGSGFALLELPVVLAIIGVLARLLLPALAKCKQKAKRVNEQEATKRWGHVHLRWTHRAVTGMADGHAESMGLTGLQDLRRWANTGDGADWTLKPLPLM